jgi:hypothetical protein
MKIVYYSFQQGSDTANTLQPQPSLPAHEMPQAALLPRARATPAGELIGDNHR